MSNFSTPILFDILCVKIDLGLMVVLEVKVRLE